MKENSQKGKEYLCSKMISNREENQLEKVIMNHSTAWEKLQDVMNHNVFHGRMDMVNNNELILFYVTDFMQESVYYHKEMK